MRQAFTVLQGAVAGLVLAAELAYLASLVYRQLNPDAPELADVVRGAWRELEQTAQNREAIRQTLASIRKLPETGAES